MAENSLETSSQLAWDKEFSPVPCDEPWGIPGAYTTLRIDGSPPQALFLDDHRQRLIQSLDHLGMGSSFESKKLGAKILSFVENRSLETPYLLRASVLSERFQLDARPLPPIGPWLEGRLLPYVRKKPEAKSLDNQLYEHVKQLNHSVEEAILLAPDGELGEAATSNLIFAKGNILIAPETNVLPGITLAKLLPELGEQYTIKRGSVQLTDLDEVTEILATGSGKEVVAFARIPEIGWKARSEDILWAARATYAEIKSSHLASLDD